MSKHETEAAREKTVNLQLTIRDEWKANTLAIDCPECGAFAGEDCDMPEGPHFVRWLDAPPLHRFVVESARLVTPWTEVE